MHNRKKTDIRVEFGKRLRAKRQEKGFTLEVLAEKADLAISYVASVERGERNLGLENIVALANALNISASELLPGAHHHLKDSLKLGFGQHLASLREKRGMTQKELANASALDPITIAFLEQGEGTITLENMIALSQALQVSLKDLMPKS